MACKYLKSCPSKTDWCKEAPKEPDSNCIVFILTAYDNLKDNISFDEFQKTVRKMTDTGTTAFIPLYEAETKISEIAELHSYHYLSNGEKYIPNQAIIKEKLGCLLWNIAEYCSLNGWKLEEIVKQTYRIDGEKENGND